jgi:hypothetical protein
MDSRAPGGQLKLSEENQRNGLDMSNNGKVLEMYEDMAKRE